jgi:hypothetical protein
MQSLPGQLGYQLLLQLLHPLQLLHCRGGIGSSLLRLGISSSTAGLCCCRGCLLHLHLQRACGAALPGTRCCHLAVCQLLLCLLPAGLQSSSQLLHLMQL